MPNGAEHPARLEALEERISQRVLEGLREENARLLREYTGMKPLMSVDDVAETCGVSSRTVERIIRRGHLKPLWIGGQRRFHPDAVQAYLHKRAGRKQV